MRLSVCMSMIILGLATTLAGCATTSKHAALGKTLEVDEPKIAVCIYSGRVVTIHSNGTRDYM
jgi:ABC-type Fe3+-hydroxamate transport system substrate-binding protein